MWSQITADLLDIDRTLKVTKRNLVHEWDETGSKTSNSEVTLTLMKAAKQGLSWMSPERSSKNTRKKLRDLTGRKLIMQGKEHYGMVDTDKRKELQLSANDWITVDN